VEASEISFRSITSIATYPFSKEKPRDLAYFRLLRASRGKAHEKGARVNHLRERLMVMSLSQARGAGFHLSPK
jgi:hypothetical protein